jgi:hypothetical protein
MRAGSSRLLCVTAIALIAVAANGCDERRPDADRHDWQLAEASEHGVTVTLRALVDDARRTWVAATYAPTMSGFHVYSKDLSREGLSGIGRPTLLEVVPGGALDPQGEVTADQTPVPLYVAALKLSFPVYPAGPVTLRLPVVINTAGNRHATFSVSYLACSDSTCLAPVTGKRIAVTLPAGYAAHAEQAPQALARSGSTSRHGWPAHETLAR